MSRLNLCFIGCLACLSFPADAFADGRWDSKVDIVTTTGLVGYRPVTILSDDGSGTFVAKDRPFMRSEVRGRMRIIGEWLELDLQPYTAIPSDQLKVSLGGLEVTLLAPVTSFARVGFYHHSSHNFSDAAYGWGIDLNAIVLDVRVLEGDLELFGETGHYRLGFLGHGYFKGRASPFVLTGSSSVAASQIGESSWKGGVLLDGEHPYGRTECAVFVTGDGPPRSMTATLSLTAKLGSRFFGAFGEHFYAGPFVGYGQNFSRIDEFGSFTLYGGIRVDLLFVDTVAERKRSERAANVASGDKT